MGDNKSTIDIEVIMENIRNTIKEKGYTNEMLGFEDAKEMSDKFTHEDSKFSYEEFLSNLDKVNQSYTVQYYRNVEGRGIKSFIKKSLRKALSFLILPMVKEQMEFNASITRSMNQLEHYVREEKKKENDYEELAEKLEKLEKELERKIGSGV